MSSNVKNGSKIVLITFACIMCNFIGKNVALSLSLPMWLDCFGTIVAAYTMGPFCGAVVGVSVNVMYGIVTPSSFYFCLTSILIGVVVGLIAKSGVFENYLRTIAWAYFIVFAASIICVPYYWINEHGLIGNVWGDGIADMLSEKGVPKILSVGAGAFYVEFIDKFVVMGLLFTAVKIKKSINKKKVESVAAVVLALIMLAPMVALPAKAAMLDSRSAKNENDYDYYIQTVYNNQNGIPGGTANDIVHMGDGIIWIGTYAGLYRYNGTEFVHMNKFESVKNVNKLFADEEGRLWIGTNDDGLSIVVNESVSNTIDERNGLPANSVRSITQQSGGLYFVGTSDSLAIVTLTGGVKVKGVIDEIKYATHLAADTDNHIVAVTDAGKLYLVTGETVTETKGAKDAVYSSCSFDEDGLLYVGTRTGTIEVYKIENDKLTYVKTIYCSSLSTINCVYIEDGQVFACADNGAGYVLDNGRFDVINTGSFDTKIENMTIDYQGDIWFASSRQGLLKLCPSPFYELYTKANMEPNVVNAITEWNNILYFGTDSGLDAMTKGGMEEFKSSLDEILEGMRIRCLKVDSRNNMWICTSGSGVYKACADGSVKVYDSSTGMLGDRFRAAIELSNGMMAFSGDNGVTVYDVEGDKVAYTVGNDDGMANAKILNVLEGFDGELYAGSDGGGIYVIKNGKVVENLTRKNGLTSGVILRMVRDEENKGLFIITSNSICYMSESGAIRSLESFPYSNNYDLYDNGLGQIFVTSSAGIYVVDKEHLLDGKHLEYDLLNTKKGLRTTLTANAWNYIDAAGNVYLAGGTGVAAFNIANYDTTTRSYRMMIKSITIDNVSHFVDKSSKINVGRGATRVSFVPEVVNFSANDPYVSYYLEGFDYEKTVLLQSELSEITYTNLPAGVYKFHLAVLDSDGINPIEEMVYIIDKEKEIYDNEWFRDLFILETVIIVGCITWFITRTQILKTLEIQNKQLELAREQVRMGDETIMAIARTVDAKDSNTSMHSTRVSEYSVLIAKKLGYTEEECELLRKIALLHDIGKIGVPDSVLNKPSRLTDEEYALMKNHVVKGAEILNDFSLVDHVSDGALYHHERYDGKGYVYGLKGEEIPLNARIIGIADSFDAMTANRVYRKKLPPEVVLEEIRKGRGTQFDPKLVDIFFELLESKVIDIEKIYEDGGVKNEA